MHTIDKQDMNHLMREANKLFMKWQVSFNDTYPSLYLSIWWIADSTPCLEGVSTKTPTSMLCFPLYSFSFQMNRERFLHQDSLSPEDSWVSFPSSSSWGMKQIHRETSLPLPFPTQVLCFQLLHLFLYHHPYLSWQRNPPHHHERKGRGQRRKLESSNIMWWINRWNIVVKTKRKTRAGGITPKETKQREGGGGIEKKRKTEEEGGNTREERK